MTNIGSQNVPLYMTDEQEHRRQIAQAVNYTKQGKINATVDVTLKPSATATLLQDSRIGTNSAITPAMAMTAHGAAAIAAGIYVDTVMAAIGSTPASAVIHHASNSANDQTIRFLIIG